MGQSSELPPGWMVFQVGEVGGGNFQEATLLPSAGEVAEHPGRGRRCGLMMLPDGFTYTNSTLFFSQLEQHVVTASLSYFLMYVWVRARGCGDLWSALFHNPLRTPFCRCWQSFWRWLETLVTCPLARLVSLPQFFLRQNLLITDCSFTVGCFCTAEPLISFIFGSTDDACSVII